MSVYQRLNHASIGATFAAAVPATSAVASAALAQRFRALHAAEATAEVAGTAAAKVAPMEA